MKEMKILVKKSTELRGNKNLPMFVFLVSLYLKIYIYIHIFINNLLSLGSPTKGIKWL